MLDRLNLSVKSKLTTMLLMLSVGAIIVVSYLGWKTSRDSLTEAVFNQLTSVRTAKTYHIETYMHFLRNQVAVLGEDEMVIRAMVRFNKSFKQAEFELIPKEWEDALDQFYQNEYFTRLGEHVTGETSLEFYKPESTAAQYLQYWYIANNASAVGDKQMLDHAGDESEYSGWHEYYHPRFRNLQQQFGYYDIFLINFESRNIVYSVEKEMDYGTSLMNGPYAKSGLAEVVERVQENLEAGVVQIVDFKAYTPSYYAPAAFFATAIFNGPHIVGILALQLPVDGINDVMTGNRNWKADGLGRSGETFLVGSDRLMRSDSRFLIQDPEDYKKTLVAAKTPARSVSLIEKFKTTILFQKVDTEASESAIKGETGTQIVNDYRQTPVLSSYAPLRIEGLDWAIVTKKDMLEVYQPIRAQRKTFIIAGVIIVTLVTFASVAFANRFVRPLTSLIESAQQVRDGRHDVVIKRRSGDEVGLLAGILNGIVDNQREQNKLLERKSYENRVLLENILPQGPAERLKRGDELVVDNVRQVTVLYASVMGFAELSDRVPSAESAKLLNTLWGLFDDAAEEHGVEPHQTAGERYIAVCGLAGLYLDHAKRSLDFALELQNALRQFNTQHQADLRLQVGVHSGPVRAGIVGAKRFKYDLWGETVNVALALKDAAAPDTILVSQQICDQVHEQFRFEPHPNLERQGKTSVEVWVLEEHMSLSSDA